MILTRNSRVTVRKKVISWIHTHAHNLDEIDDSVMLRYRRYSGKAVKVTQEVYYVEKNSFFKVLGDALCIITANSRS